MQTHHVTGAWSILVFLRGWVSLWRVWLFLFYHDFVIWLCGWVSNLIHVYFRAIHGDKWFLLASLIHLVSPHLGVRLISIVRSKPWWTYPKWRSILSKEWLALSLCLLFANVWETASAQLRLRLVSVEIVCRHVLLLGIKVDYTVIKHKLKVNLWLA